MQRHNAAQMTSAPTATSEFDPFLANKNTAINARKPSTKKHADPHSHRITIKKAPKGSTAPQQYMPMVNFASPKKKHDKTAKRKKHDYDYDDDDTDIESEKDKERRRKKKKRREQEDSFSFSGYFIKVICCWLPCVTAMLRCCRACCAWGSWWSYSSASDRCSHRCGTFSS